MSQLFLSETVVLVKFFEYFTNIWWPTRLSKQFLPQGLWERTNSNDSRINNVFILLFYIFLWAWLNSRFSRKPVNCEAYIHANISGVNFTFIDLYVTFVKTFHELELRYLLYPRSEKYEEENNFIFNTQKLADRKSNRQKVSAWTDIPLSCFYKQMFM